MRLSEQAKSRGPRRTLSRDMLGEQHTEPNPFAELQLLFTPEVKESIEDPGQILRGEHRTQFALAYVLQQAVPDLDFTRLQEVAKEEFVDWSALGGKISAELEKEIFDPSLIHLLALQVSCNPERRSEVSVPDQVFSHWLRLLDESDRRSTEQSSLVIATILFDLLILRPDKQTELQNYLHDHGWDEVLWRGKKIEANAYAFATAVVRVIEPRYSLTLQERKTYVREYAEAQQIPILAPSIQGWVALAILLSPEVEMSSQGRVRLKTPPQAVEQPKPLPPRMAI